MNNKRKAIGYFYVSAVICLIQLLNYGWQIYKGVSLDGSDSVFPIFIVVMLLYLGYVHWNAESEEISTQENLEQIRSKKNKITKVY